MKYFDFKILSVFLLHYSGKVKRTKPTSLQAEAANCRGPPPLLSHWQPLNLGGETLSPTVAWVTAGSHCGVLEADPTLLTTSH